MQLCSYVYEEALDPDEEEAGDAAEALDEVRVGGAQAGERQHQLREAHRLQQAE